MANQEHLDILKQGVNVWNQWREEHPEILPDLNQADLRRADLSRAILFEADLRQAILYRAKLSEADLGGAKLSEADLSEATLYRADLTRANLYRAILSRADLSFVNLREANLNQVDLTRATVGWILFADVDLRQVQGLITLHHSGPSHISIGTIYRSEGQIPEDFLRKAGVPDSFIDYMHSLVIKPIDYYTCFISYSSKDHAFADRLYTDLQSKGVRCWFAPEHMKIGDEIRTWIDESIRVYDKLLLVLSHHSIKSTWVKNEVEAAFEKEEQQSTSVLFPIAVDDEIKRTTQTWAASIRRRKHIGDFTRWKQHDDYQQAFERLLRDLKAETHMAC